LLPCHVHGDFLFVSLFTVDVVSWLWLLYGHLCICVYLQHVKQQHPVIPAPMTQTLLNRVRRVCDVSWLPGICFYCSYIYPNCWENRYMIWILADRLLLYVRLRPSVLWLNVTSYNKSVWTSE